MFSLRRTVCFKLPTSVLTSSTDLKSLDMEASLDCGDKEKHRIIHTNSAAIFQITALVPVHCLKK